MAYRKLLTQKTYDELKSLDDECLVLNIEFKNDDRECVFKPSIVLGGDEKVRYKIDIDVNGETNYHSLYGETLFEINNALKSYTMGLRM